MHNVSFAFELMQDGGLKKPKARPEGMDVPRGFKLCIKSSEQVYFSAIPFKVAIVPQSGAVKGPLEGFAKNSLSVPGVYPARASCLEQIH